MKMICIDDYYKQLKLVPYTHFTTSSSIHYDDNIVKWVGIVTRLHSESNVTAVTGWIIHVNRSGALVQWLKLPAWKVGVRGFEPHSELQVSKK